MYDFKHTTYLHFAWLIWLGGQMWLNGYFGVWRLKGSDYNKTVIFCITAGFSLFI